MKGSFLQVRDPFIKPVGKRHEILMDDKAGRQHDNADPPPG